MSVVPLRATAPASDFIDDFMELTEFETSPEIFRRWTAIAMVAGALERRVWAVNAEKTVWPNLYTLLVAPPAVGKFIIELARDLWEEALEPDTKVPAFHVAPNSMTKASLMDELAKSRSQRLTPKAGDPPYVFHSLLIAAEEFSVLLPAYDLEYIGVLNDIYNNKARHSETRRTGSVREVNIANPQLNILAGVQPSYMASVFPEEIWQSGIARRFIMIYSGEEILLDDLFQAIPKRQETRERIVKRLSQFSDLFGKAKWSQEAMELLGAWYKGGQKPKPTHSKLSSYCRARVIHLLKLCIISAIAKDNSLVISAEAVQRAMQWLFEAEALMPDIFREMVGRSDSQVLEELHLMVQQLWLSDGKPLNGVRGAVIHHWLAHRVPAEKIDRILAVAVNTGMLSPVGETGNFRPMPKGGHGVE